MQNPKVIQQSIRHWCAFLKDFRTYQNLTMDEVDCRIVYLKIERAVHQAIHKLH